MKIKYVDVNDCIPMEEVGRIHYSESSINHLTKVMARDGFKEQYSPRAFYDKKLEKYVIFDGAHRLFVAKKLGIRKIPLIDETGTLSKSQIVAEGIKANSTHGYYNAIDIARNLQALQTSLSSTKKNTKSVGRPVTVNLTNLSDFTGLSEQKISRYLRLLNLPEDVQTLVGQGKLHMTSAITLMTLDKTPYSNMILELAQEAASKRISGQELRKRVAMIKKKGHYDDEKQICIGCKKDYSRDSVSFQCLCPACLDKVRSGRFQDPNQRRTLAMLRFLNLRNWAEKKHKEGFELPDWFFDRLQHLETEWKGVQVLDEVSSNGF